MSETGICYAHQVSGWLKKSECPACQRTPLAAPTPRTNAYLRNIYNPASRKCDHPTAIPRAVAEAGIKLLNELERELATAQAELQAAKAHIAQFIEAQDDHNRLVRELDVICNGPAGAAKQASLCDMVAQIKKELQAARRDAGKVLKTVQSLDGKLLARFYDYGYFEKVMTAIDSAISVGKGVEG